MFFHYLFLNLIKTHEINIALPKRGAKVMSVHGIDIKPNPFEAKKLNDIDTSNGY